eukprot:gene2122-2762_t
MSIGNSGRIVIEVDPHFKRNLYSALAKDGMSLKDWFLREVNVYLSASAIRTDARLNPVSLKNTDLQDLLSVTSGIGVAYKAGKSLEQRLTGRFYTHERIGKAMALDIARRFTNNALTDIKLIDPFCGDGRLICWVLDALKNLGWSPRGNSSITLWDCDESSVRVAELAIAKSLSIHGLNSLVKVESLVADTFTIAPGEATIVAQHLVV